MSKTYLSIAASRAKNKGGAWPLLTSPSLSACFARAVSSSFTALSSVSKFESFRASGTSPASSRKRKEESSEP